MFHGVEHLHTLILMLLMLVLGSEMAWGQATEIRDVAGLNAMTADGNYVITDDINAASFSASIASFSGTLTAQAKDDGTFPVISNLSKPLFTTATNATISNIILDQVNISQEGKTGSIACVANGATRIYNCGILSGEIKSTGTSTAKNSTDCCGGLVGELFETARVINCYSYATITGGNRVGGIVGYNNATTTAGSINTMVMNCMFYGDITGGNMVSPIYGGTGITNLKDNSDRTKDGLNTFNYYAYDKLKTKSIGSYNCALAVEEKYLNRFEFYRQLLNSNKTLAAYYASTSTTTVNPSDMAKWVLETADRSISGRDPYPYPILKQQGKKYPSIINIDSENAPQLTLDENGRPKEEDRNKGGKLGKTLSVTISTSKTDGGQEWPEGASINTTSLTLQRTDKDEDRFNFNYDKVQLPYYNDVGIGNYTENKAVTGWKITAITTVDDDPYTTANYDYGKTYLDNPEYFDYPNYNFANRKSSNKDKYSVSGRVFSQGAYFDVPYGVTSITIEPYWGKAIYVTDKNYDVVYKNDYSGKQAISYLGEHRTTFNSQIVSNSISVSSFADGSSVYDNAVVLVGNLHLDGVPSNGTKAFTMMSVDEDNDHEPDYSLIYHHKSRLLMCPIRFDFLNVIGTAQAQKPNGASNICNMTICKTRGWFEITNTALMYFSQFEYENLGNSNSSDNKNKVDAPLILQGGVFDQFVSTQQDTIKGKVIYIHVGGNVWMHEFGMGTHSDGSYSTPHVPVSVTGGDFDSFYLTGTYNSNAAVRDDNAECYISGGRFGEMAGAGQEQIGNTNSANNGNVRWQIYDADITNFFGGGINDAKPVQGQITTDIFNSHVTTFCGGPKFGNMASGKTVTTNAEGCTFGMYFGAGYGGNSFSRKKYTDLTSVNWNTWAGYYTGERGKFYDGSSTACSQDKDKDYGKKGLGVAVDFDYEFFVWSSGATGGRFFVKFVSFSLATCNDVSSSLKGCTVTGNFYGGGSLGKVIGTATSELDDCTVNGSVFGAGYSATLPTISVRTAGFTTNPNYNKSSGMFEPGVYSGTEEYTWKQVDSYPNEGGAGFDGTQVITTQNISHDNLGSVGTVVLRIKGETNVDGNVYGGGDESAVSGNSTVTVQGSATVSGNVYGGGNLGDVGTHTGTAGNYTWTENTGACIVNIEGGTTGSVFGAGKGIANTFQCEKGMVYKANVNVSGGTVNGTVYGGGEIGRVENDTEVKIGDGEGSEETETPTPIIHGNVFGAGKGLNTHGYSALVRGNSEVTVEGDAKVDGSIYGGGEISSVGRYTLVNEENKDDYPGLEIGMPGSLVNSGSGKCTVIVQGHAEIGPDGMQMTASGGPDDAGHIFGAGKGATPQVYTYDDKDNMPKRMMAYTASLYPADKEGITWEYADAEHQNVWEYFDTEAKYLTFIETMALTNQTEVTVDGTAFVKGSVYGGSENGFVQHNTKVMIKGGQIGAGAGESSPYADNKFINPATTTITSANTLKACATWDYEADGAPYDKFAGSTGYDAKGGAVTATDGHTFYGNVFGGGSGLYPYAPGKWHRKAGPVGGDTRIEISGGHILSNVYGGNEQTDVGTYTHDANDAPIIADGGTCTIVMTGGTIGVPRTATAIEALPTIGHLYGAGKGDKRILFNTWTNVGATSVSVSGGIVYGNVYGGGEDGHVMGNAVTTISETDATNKPTVIGSVGDAGLDGNVFGGGQGSPTALTAGVMGGNANLNVQGGHMLGSVYGGGRIASVGTYFAMASDPRYGKMQEDVDDDEATTEVDESVTHGHLTVNLTGGTIEQNVYGGCMGTNAAADADAEAIAFAAKLGMSKTVEVNLNKDVANDARGCAVKGDIFGCNNTNASPQQAVTVHVYATQNAGKTQIANTSGETPVTDAKRKGVYDVRAVYGGGNLAAYKPVGPNPTADDDDGKNTTYSTNVIIDGCGLTSIQTVYGGGNAASTPATGLTVNGTYEIEEVFGGGNGKDAIGKDDNGDDIPNPGANVGFYDYSAVEETYSTKDDRQDDDFTSKYVYGSGKASVNIFGGTIHRVFGGSNTKGNVRQTAVTMLEEAGGCDFCVDEAYGGGKSAPMDAEAKLLMACIPGLKEAYGGAEAANIEGNVTLNITNGTFDRVFGGNNLSGTISGKITVNVEETGCRPVVIGELYGGGNLAAYSIYGYDDDGTPKESGDNPFDDPEVNVRSFTSIGAVYGGGYGTGAKMIANPTVNINESVGSPDTYPTTGDYDANGFKGKTITLDEGKPTEHTVTLPAHKKGEIGAIGSVFGGGNAADVKGNTNVNVGTSEYEEMVSVATGDDVTGYYTRSGEGTEASPYTYTKATGTAEEGTTYYQKVKGANITGNVYGGGNNAVVTGDTHVVIGKKKE